MNGLSYYDMGMLGLLLWALSAWLLVRDRRKRWYVRDGGDPNGVPCWCGKRHRKA